MTQTAAAASDISDHPAIYVPVSSAHLNRVGPDTAHGSEPGLSFNRGSLSLSTLSWTVRD